MKYNEIFTYLKENPNATLVVNDHATFKNTGKIGGGIQFYDEFPAGEDIQFEFKGAVLRKFEANDSNWALVSRVYSSAQAATVALAFEVLESFRDGHLEADDHE